MISLHYYKASPKWIGYTWTDDDKTELQKVGAARMVNEVLTVDCRGNQECEKYCEDTLNHKWKGDDPDTNFPGCGNMPCCQKRTRKSLYFHHIRNDFTVKSHKTNIP